MTENFWTGFTKQADLLAAARKGMQAAATKATGVAEEAAHDLGQYWKKAPTESVPMWKQKLLAQGKKPLTASAVSKAKPTAGAATSAEQVLQQRRENLARGGIPHSTFQKAIQEPPQVAVKKPT